MVRQPHQRPPRLEMGTATRTEGWRSGAVDGKEVAGEVAVLLDDDERRRPVHARPGEKWIWEVRGLAARKSGGIWGA